MSKKIIIVDENPEFSVKMPASLVQQGHKFCKCIVREAGQPDTEPKVLHLTAEMYAEAEKPGTETVKKEAPKKAAAKKAAPKKAAAKKTGTKKGK